MDGVHSFHGLRIHGRMEKLFTVDVVARTDEMDSMKCVLSNANDTVHTVAHNVFVSIYCLALLQY